MLKLERLRAPLTTICAASALLLASAPATHAAFPGRNGKIAYSSGSFTIRGGVTNIFTIHPYGDDPLRQLTDGPDLKMAAAWSADGRRIAFARFSFESDRSRIYVSDANGSHARAVSPAGANDTSPAWSPDGRRLVFARRAAGDGSADLWIKDLGSGREHRLTNTAGIDEGAPSWSVRGRIAFERFTDESRIHAIDPDGSDPALLSREGGDYNPDWYPDGSALAFGRRVDRSGGQAGADLFRMDPDGGSRVELGDTGSERIPDPHWAPDGTRVVYTRYEDGDSDIWLMNVEGRYTRALVTRRGDDLFPAWQPAVGGGRRRPEPPDCSTVRPDRRRLWPPDRRRHLVYLRDSRDPEGHVVRVEIEAVTQDEPVVGRGDRTSPDASLSSIPNRAYLRAERQKGSSGDGRVYRLIFKASTRGGSCRGVRKIVVPRHARGWAVNSGRYFNSLRSVAHTHP